MTKAANLAALGTSSGASVLVQGTAVNSTSGTSIDFTGIPSWVKRITIVFSGVSFSGASGGLVQIGSGSITTTGYTSVTVYSASTNTVGSFGSSSGFAIGTGSAADTTMGHFVLTLVSGNSWVSSHTINRNGWGVIGGGIVTIGGTLDRIRITSANGTDTFDAGSINILYE